MIINVTTGREPETSVWGVSLGITPREFSLTLEAGERYVRFWVDRKRK